MSENTIEVLLEMGSEGGGYTIQTALTPEGRRFRLSTDSLSIDADDQESWISSQKGWHKSLEEVFPEVNPNWHRLIPVTVHPDFAAEIWEKYVAACQQSQDPPGRYMGIWTGLLLGRRFSNLTDAIAHVAVRRSD